MSPACFRGAPGSLVGRKRKPKPPKPCRDCGLLPEATDFEGSNRPGRWLGGICPACRETGRRARKAATGQKLLDKAKTTTVIRDGREYVVKQLPPKRRSR